MDVDTFAPWFSNGFYILGVIYLVMRMLAMFKRTPHIDVDFGEIKKDLDAIKSCVENKQDAQLCETMNRQMTESIAEIRTRQTRLESKQSTDVHGIYTRLESIANKVSADIGGLKGTLETYIKLREGK